MPGSNFKSVGVNLFTRCPHNPIITTHILPYPANSIFNAGAAVVNNWTILLARVEDMRGISHLTVLRSKDGVTNWIPDEVPSYPPEPEKFPEELWGVEDPRITFLDDLKKFAICYTAYSRRGPQVSLAFTEDFKTFERKGVILPPEDKNASLFPCRFNDNYAVIHRPVAVGQDSNIWMSFSTDLKRWGDHTMILECRRGAWWDSHRIGACPPPLRTEKGWLLLYHGVRSTVSGQIYRLGIALLDLNEPTKVLKRSDEWIFGPADPYELIGDVHNVVFPCGWILDEDSRRIRLYYGAADTSIGLATANIDEIFDYLETCPQPKQS
jgi:predicted GH43/DUF377 family glycosyl hydrolase